MLERAFVLTKMSQQRIFLALLLMLAFVSSSAQTLDGEAASRGTQLTVALITFGPGEELWERFGHNAIEIRDNATGAARLYNYGMFDFAQENFFVNFARGRMMYRIAVGDPAEEYPIYVDEGRWIVRQGRISLIDGTL